MPAPSHPFDDRLPLEDGERRHAHPLPMRRRDFLKRSAMAVAGATLFSCTGGRVIPKVENATPQIDTRWPIKRVLYLMLENRSFNNLFGKFPGVTGTTVGVDLGKERPLIRCPDWLPGDIPHDRSAGLNHINGGTMDGFSSGTYGPIYAYSQFDEDQIPNYWLWAREFSLSDHFFASVNGPSYPNHFFFIAGTSGGVIDNPENITTRVLDDGSKFKSWGCDAVGDDVFVLVKDDHGNLTKHDTCFRFPTVAEQLGEIGVDWTYYSPVPGQAGYFWNAFNGVESVFHSDAWQQRMRPIDRIVQDIERGDLPAVTWAVPRFELSDHPPFSTGHAHNWVTDIVNAVMRSDMWQHTAIFITWDEWGGFYDPVLPPEVDDAGFGIRVPMLTISSYTQRGVIDDEVGEFSSPLKFIADNWGLHYLTDRIENTHNFEHVFDFRKKPRDPVLGNHRAPAFGDDPFEWVGDTYDGWKLPPGVEPVEAPV